MLIWEGNRSEVLGCVGRAGNNVYTVKKGPEWFNNGSEILLGSQICEDGLVGDLMMKY